MIRCKHSKNIYINLIYFSDHCNVIDFVTILVYALIFIFRLVAWLLDQGVPDNRKLTVANYLYGLNTLLLTFRAFGHVMESKKGMGGIQIALFKIVGDVVGIFWQFGAAILAFSFAITKVYVAERSFNSGKNITDRLVFLFLACIIYICSNPLLFSVSVSLAAI